MTAAVVVATIASTRGPSMGRGMIDGRIELARGNELRNETHRQHYGAASFLPPGGTLLAQAQGKGRRRRTRYMY